MILPTTKSSHSATTVDLNDSPVDMQNSSFISPYLPLPPNSAGPSSTSLNRRNSSKSNSSGLIPSPRLAPVMLPPSSTPISTTSSGSGSKTSSFISMNTPRLLSRKNSVKEKSSATVKRNGSVKGKAKEEPDGYRSPMSESGSVEVIETPLLKVQSDPESGRKMINQYLVLNLIGSGAHGKVRLGRDLSGENGDEEGDGVGSGTGQYYAIKIVDRNPKRKRLTGFSKQKGLLGKSKADGGKLVNESEIRKEIAIFKKVNHPNVVRMKEIIDDPDSSRIFMILEFCEGGEIVWKNEDGPALTVAETRNIFRDTLLGLEYLHHQGIIHRDIKPSNLLYSRSGTVKISDFGCSHYSEALREASALGDDEYVDDIELAKTAGSPAFFAPEMCYSSLDHDLGPPASKSPKSPIQEVPGFTLRPPSYLDDGSEIGSPDIIPLRPSMSNDSALASLRSRSSAGRQRLPITNAIDVWALGVTLYCLFFGRTPFDAPNEYLLMQIIPIADYEVPPIMGRDKMPTNGSNQEANECLDILKRLLEKAPGKRISLEQAKKHPFTLRGISDPSTWLASTDPHAQTFVTVSNDEVAAVIQKGKLRDRIKKGIMSIGHKLQLLGSTSRSRSRSIGEQDQSTPNSAYASTTPSALPSQVNMQNLVSPKVKSRNGMSPLPSPAPTLSRRFSLLSSKLERVPSPVQSALTVQLSSLQPQTRLAATEVPGFHVNRPQLHLATAQKPAMVPLTDDNDAPRSPRQVASSSSLDKYKIAAPESASLSPASSLRRRQSSDIDLTGRQRSTSNASSGLGKLVRLLSRTNSQRSSRFRKKAPSISASSDWDDHAIVSDTTSPAEAVSRISLDEARPRTSHETEDFVESSSYSSSSGVPSRFPGIGLHPSPDRVERLNAWDSRYNDSRYNGLRRGSGLSEHFTNEHFKEGVDVLEEVDWDGDALSDDDDDYVEAHPLPRSVQFPKNFGKGLGLDIDPLITTNSHSHPQGVPVDHHIATSPNLDTIPDASPDNAPIPKVNLSPTASTHIINDFHPRSPTRPRGSQSPYRGNYQGPERARSPLGMREEMPRHAGRASPIRYTPPPSMGIGSIRGNRSNISVDVTEEQDERDEGLAISLNGRRGRKSSILGRRLSEDRVGVGLGVLPVAGAGGMVPVGEK